MADDNHRALTETSNKIWLEDMLKSMNLVAMDVKHDQLTVDLLIIINSCIAIFIVVNMGIFLIFLLQQKEMQDAMLARGKKRRMLAKKEAAYMYLKPSKFCQTIFPEPLYATPPDSHYSKISSGYAFYENADFLEQQQQQATPHSLPPVSSRLTPGKSLRASDSSNLWLRVRSTLTGNFSDYRDTASSQPNSSRATSDSKHLDDNRSSSKQPLSKSDSNLAVSSNRGDCDNYINSSSSPNNRSSDNRSSDNRSSGNHSSDNRSSDNHSSDNHSSDNHSSDNRISDNHSSEHQGSDNDYVNA